MSDSPGDSARINRASGLRGGGQVLLGSGATFVIQLASLAVLSRLLDPEDFGLVAMVMVFVVLGNLLRDFGLPMAGLQMRTLSTPQASNLFWMNTAIAALASVALVLSTPLLVSFYGDERLSKIVPAFGLVVLIGGVTAQFQVHLARRMQFGVLVMSDIVAQVLGLASAIALALMGAGYWALVCQALVVALATLTYRWVASGWIPSRFQRGHGSKAMLRVGMHYGLAQVLSFLQGNVDTLVIGSRLGAVPLGYYNRAFQLMTTPASRLLDPLTQVVVTTLNKIEASGEDSRPTLRRIQFAVGTFIVWLFSVSAGIAPSLLPIVLGPEWTPSITVFQILALGGCFWVFNHVSYWAFIVHNKARELLHYNMVSKPLAIAGIIVGSLHGIQGVAWGYSVAMILSWPLNLAWLARVAQLPALAFAATGVRILAAGAATAGAASLATLATQGAGDLLETCAGLAAGTATMIAVTSLTPSSRREIRSWMGTYAQN